MKNIDFLSDADKPKILLIGDAEKLFSDGQDIGGLGVEICSNILDGIETAAGGDCDLIAVAMSGSSAKLTSAIEALRTANSGSRRAKIILLAQMYQEPAAKQLVGNGSNGGWNYYHFAFATDPLARGPSAAAARNSTGRST